MLSQLILVRKRAGMHSVSILLSLSLSLPLPHSFSHMACLLSPSLPTCLSTPPNLPLSLPIPLPCSPHPHLLYTVSCLTFSSSSLAPSLSPYSPPPPPTSHNLSPPFLHSTLFPPYPFSPILPALLPALPSLSHASFPLSPIVSFPPPPPFLHHPFSRSVPRLHKILKPKQPEPWTSPVIPPTALRSIDTTETATIDVTRPRQPRQRNTRTIFSR